MRIEPVTLEGTHVRLEPLSLERHAGGLIEIGLDPVLWRWATARIETAADLRGYVEHALADQAAGRSLPFATIERAGGRIVGSTRFMSFAVPHRRVEIGCTWIARPWQRTAINTEAKYLMLRHAFETWGCQRVELKTDTRNERSRHAWAASRRAPTASTWSPGTARCATRSTTASSTTSGRQSGRGSRGCWRGADRQRPAGTAPDAGLRT
jgi:hypothetical protein